MTWADFYLICFAVGFLFSLLSFLAGGLRWHWHTPHISHAHIPVAHPPAGTASPPGHAPGTTAAPGQAAAHSPAAHIFPFSLVTVAAFLAWFGGTGYLLTLYSSIWFLAGLGLAVLTGLVGGGIVFLFLSRVLISHEENLDPADFEMVGVLGRISVPVRAQGTGEIIYSQAGTRRNCGARSENGAAIAKGSEVVVARYEKGIAYVRLWTDIAGED
jgi:membrane protein implicated in regulation of membrane protease activity